MGWQSELSAGVGTVTFGYVESLDLYSMQKHSCDPRDGSQAHRTPQCTVQHPQTCLALESHSTYLDSLKVSILIRRRASVLMQLSVLQVKLSPSSVIQTPLPAPYTSAHKPNRPQRRSWHSGCSSTRRSRRPKRDGKGLRSTAKLTWGLTAVGFPRARHRG